MGFRCHVIRAICRERIFYVCKPSTVYSGHRLQYPEKFEFRINPLFSMKSINQSLCIVKVKLYWSKHAFNQMHVWNKTRQIFGAWILPDKTRSAASFFTERERAQGCERNADVTSLLSTPVTVYLPSTSQAKACKSLLGFLYSKLASGCHRGLTWLCTKR